MSPPLAFVSALLLAVLTISSASIAQSSDWVHFTLEPQGASSPKIHASFRDVELKALNLTPEFVRTAVGAGQPMPSVNDLVEIKLFGRKR